MIRRLTNTLTAASTVLFLFCLGLYTLSFFHYPLRIFGDETSGGELELKADHGWLLCYRRYIYAEDDLITHLSLWPPLVLFILPLLAVIAWDLQHRRKSTRPTLTSTNQRTRPSIWNRLITITSLTALLLAFLTCVLWWDSYQVSVSRWILREADPGMVEDRFLVHSFQGELNIFMFTTRPLSSAEKTILSTGLHSAFNETTALRMDQTGFGPKGWRLELMQTVWAKEGKAHTHTWLELPCYLITLMFLTFSLASPLCWWRAKHRARQIAAGLCPQCGYDLRASPDQCPECGHKRSST